MDPREELERQLGEILMLKEMCETLENGGKEWLDAIAGYWQEVGEPDDDTAFADMVFDHFVPMFMARQLREDDPREHFGSWRGEATLQWREHEDIVSPGDVEAGMCLYLRDGIKSGAFPEGRGVKGTLIINHGFAAHRQGRSAALAGVPEHNDRSLVLSVLAPTAATALSASINAFMCYQFSVAVALGDPEVVSGLDCHKSVVEMIPALQASLLNLRARYGIRTFNDLEDYVTAAANNAGEDSKLRAVGGRESNVISRALLATLAPERYPGSPIASWREYVHKPGSPPELPDIASAIDIAAVQRHLEAVSLNPGPNFDEAVRGWKEEMSAHRRGLEEGAIDECWNNRTRAAVRMQGA